MNVNHSDRITGAVNALPDTDCLENAAAGQVWLHDDESVLPFENGFAMGVAFCGEAMLAKYAGQAPTIYAADDERGEGAGTRFFFFGTDEDDVLAKIAAAKAEHDAR